MSSDDEECGTDLNYGIEDEFGKSFGKNNHDDDESNHLNFDEVEDENDLGSDDDLTVPKYEKNPKFGMCGEDSNENSNDDNSPIEDLLNLINDEDDVVEEKEEERKIIKIKKEKVKSLDDDDDDDEIQAKKAEPQKETKQIVNLAPKSKSSITITKIPKEERVFTEKNTGLALIKSNFKSEIELNSQLMTDCGKFYKLTELGRRMHEIKEKEASFEWYTVFILGSKSETKCSAKGNNYSIWQIHDLGNLERQNEISLFLFGNSYKTHWKSNDFEVFALRKPEFLDSNKNQNNGSNQAGMNAYYNNGNLVAATKKLGGNAGNWNKFASKKQNDKLSLSIKSDFQLIPLGTAKDIGNCQSFTKVQGSSTNGNDFSKDAAKKCRNLVNLEQAPYCVYHCVLNDKNKANKNKYSMNKPAGATGGVNRFGTTNLFESTLKANPGDIKFLPNSDILQHRNAAAKKPAVVSKVTLLEQKNKIAKEIKSEILLSLNSSISQQSMASSPVLANVVYKTNKKCDKEMLALLNGKDLGQDELKQIRLAEQATVKFTGNTPEISKEVKSVFNSKAVLPNESNCNTFGAVKLLELKKTLQSNSKSLSLSQGGDMSSLLKEKYEEKKKNFNLSNMQSHKDILKEIKRNKEDKKDAETETPVVEVEVKPDPPKGNSLVLSDFLKKRISEIKKVNSPSASPLTDKNSIKPSLQKPKNDDSFDLELYVGDKLTTQKLLDVKSKYVPHSASTCTTQSYKRKLDEIKPKKNEEEIENKNMNESFEEKKAKKLKMIDDILNIKSSHAREANDPEKNPHLKSYYDKMEQQEAIDDKLCSIKNREVRALTCKICDYTAFSQSDFCKLKKHPITRHLSMQRFFKCKDCKKRLYTLDQIYPSKACAQCGSGKFESSTMKEQDTSITIHKNVDLNQQSEYLIDL